MISISQLNAQVSSKSPKTVTQALETLQNALAPEVKTRLSSIASDSLLIWYRDSHTEFEVMNEWFVKSSRRSKTKNARFGRFYKKKGLVIPYDMIEVVLRTYQAQLRGEKTSHEEILEPFQLRQLKHNDEDKVRFVTDSLRGIYIPSNLQDCFKSLDKIYADSTKNKIAKLTEDEYLSRNHLFGIGVWMRNNWHLWGGSRLSKYFNQIGIYHPDDMSGIIMDSYHRYLRNEEIQLDKQVKYYQEYWKKVQNKNGG